MGATYPPSKALPQDHGPLDAAFARSRKWRALAIKDLFCAGNSAESISKWSGIPLGRLMEILGAEAVVSDLFMHSRWSFQRIAKETGLPLADVARLVGGRTRSSKHLQCEEPDEDDAIAALLDSLRKGGQAA